MPSERVKAAPSVADTGHSDAFLDVRKSTFVPSVNSLRMLEMFRQSLFRLVT